MKKRYIFFLVFACLSGSVAFAQVDSSDFRKSEKRMMKQEKRTMKQEKKVKRMNSKMEKSQKRLNRQNRKLNKANRQTNQEMRDMEKKQEKIEEARKDSIPNTSLQPGTPGNTKPPAKKTSGVKTFWPYNKSPYNKPDEC